MLPVSKSGGANSILRWILGVLACICLATVASSNELRQTGSNYREWMFSQSTSADPWSASDLIQPADFAQTLISNSQSEQRPLILQIGIVYLYRMAHIPGSKYDGQASTAAGIETLKKDLQDLARDREIVLYCGCCPWKNCPNLRPAFAALRELGFKKVKLLNLPTSFAQDWVSKGYPVEKGGA
jgi:thiosulfate/3-mercaptopyruvate sulfurtransferase